MFDDFLWLKNWHAGNYIEVNRIPGKVLMAHDVPSPVHQVRLWVCQRHL